MKPKCKYRLRLSIGKGADGIYHYKSFTGYGDTPAQARRDAERLSREWQVLHKTESKIASMTLADAYAAYIDSKCNVLSPASITTYIRMSKRNVQSIMQKPIDLLTQADIQSAINIEAQTLSPKTVRSIHGLLSAVLKQYRPNFNLHTTLPQKIRHEIYVPSNSDVEKLLSVCDADLKKVIILAAIGSLRRAEVCALRYEDIDGNVLHIRQVMVESPEGGFCIKPAPKTEAGFRMVTMPHDAIAVLGKESDDGRVVPFNPTTAYKGFCKALERAELPHFRLHDLRHYQASILHALGVPDKYIMERGGWKTDSTLKNIYQHTMEDKRKEVEDSICNYFDNQFKGKL